MQALLWEWPEPGRRKQQGSEAGQRSLASRRSPSRRNSHNRSGKIRLPVLGRAVQA